VIPMEAYTKLKERIMNLGKEENEAQIRIVVQVGICSQAAGVLDVIKALEEAMFHQGIENTIIKKTGCAGFCAYEPLVTLEKIGCMPITYCRVTPERARILLSEYVLKGRIIESWTLNGKDVML
jgi:NADP-reducing hydrogenase subunit HndB